MTAHPVRFPRFVFVGPGPVRVTMGDEADTPRCRQAVLPPHSLTPRQCKKVGTTLEEGTHWYCHNHKGLK